MEITKLLTYRETAEILRISENTLRQYVSKGKVPFTNIGRRVFFTPKQIQKIIDSGKREPIGGQS